MRFRFIFHRQLDAMDCGAACLQMVARAHGQFFSLESLRERTYADRDGVSMLAISDAADQIGLHTLAVAINIKQLSAEAPLPAIVFWRNKHFVVVYKANAQKVWIADPAEGKFTLSHAEFLEGWSNNKQAQTGFVLLLEPTDTFAKQEGQKISKNTFTSLWPFLSRYTSYLWQIGLGVFLVSLINLAMPFLTQAVVDVGINNQDLNFIYLVLAAQLALFLGRMAIEIIRGWMLLHIGSRVHIQLVSSYLAKMLQLPLRFFHARQTGDLLQRIQDNQRVEHFLTSATLYSLFSAFNLVVFGIVLLVYYPLIFLVFLVATLLYVLWVVFFLKRRRLLDYRRFDRMSQNQSDLIELITGVTDAKAHNATKHLRWRYERNQARLFKLSVDYLSLENYQRAGANIIIESSNILITFLAAAAVIKGDLSLGAMLAIQYIIGQLHAPVEQLLGFVQLAQDASISLERMREITDKPEEDNIDAPIDVLPEKADLVFENVSFHYGSQKERPVLNNISLTIPYGKTTAIVGLSGSGKTTLLKLLLGFYEPTEGQIRLNSTNLRYIRRQNWRAKCGAVLQDGFIFSDTIAANIALGQTKIDKQQLYMAAEVANLQAFVDSRPLGFQTKIGDAGSGLSQGQKQRILIARALYKQPEYLFFDEATNALDSFNELMILDQIEANFDHVTRVVVAHRLSTVKNADQIVVLEHGEIIEQGSHAALIALQGAYFQLVRNQLELGA